MVNGGYSSAIIAEKGDGSHSFATGLIFSSIFLRNSRFPYFWKKTAKRTILMPVIPRISGMSAEPSKISKTRLKIYKYMPMMANTMNIASRK